MGAAYNRCHSSLCRMEPFLWPILSILNIVSFLYAQGAPVTFWDILFKTNSINFPKRKVLYVLKFG